MIAHLFAGIILTGMADVPGKRPEEPPQVRIEGQGGFVAMPPPGILRAYHIKPGSTISIETAREIAIDLGAVYPPEIILKLERLEKMDRGN